MSRDYYKRGIPTRYKSDMMRSRLEARWAKVFDKLGIEYYYEPEIYTFGDISYLPDFYLPQQNVFFEAKGVMTDKDELKISKLAENTKKDIVIGYPNGSFQLVDMTGHEMLYGENGKETQITDETYRLCSLPEHWYSKGETWLAKCEKCKEWHFLNFQMVYDCRICGYYAGDQKAGSYIGDENIFNDLGVNV